MSVKNIKLQNKMKRNKSYKNNTKENKIRTAKSQEGQALFTVHLRIRHMEDSLIQLGIRTVFIL